MRTTAPTRSRLATMARAAVPLLAVAAAAAVLLRFPPEQYGFYPRCPIHESFGLLCPGCGTTRALAALLHGDLRGALRWNPLTTTLAPAAAGYGAAFYVQGLRGRPLRLPQPPAFAVYATLAVAAVFTVARNL